MTDTRLHIRVIPPEDRAQFWALCGLKVVGTSYRYQSAYAYELDHAIHMSGDVCAECRGFYERQMMNDG